LLRNSKQIVYLASSLGKLAPALSERFSKLGIQLEIRNLTDTELSTYVQQNDVPVLIAKKLFRTEMPQAEKLATLLREFSFNRFGEEALGMINQLEGIADLAQEDLRMTALGRLVERIVETGTVLPLYQQRFSLMVAKRFGPVVIDLYGRIVWSELKNEDK
jgi:MarR-like DNA-binding transcriptional regulator SgrR of sgrS sRNA